MYTALFLVIPLLLNQWSRNIENSCVCVENNTLISIIPTNKERDVCMTVTAITWLRIFAVFGVLLSSCKDSNQGVVSVSVNSTRINHYDNLHHNIDDSHRQYRK